MKFLRILFVSNKKLPSNDHRLAYSKLSKICSIIYALPEKPEMLDENYYVKMGFGEGFRLSYIFHFLVLFGFLIKNRKKFDLVHFSSTNLILLGPILSWFARKPSIITITGFGRTFSTHKFKFRLLRFLYMFFLRISLHCVRRALFQNHYDLDWLTKRFPSLSYKFKYVGSAVSMPIITQKNFYSHKLRVLHVARLLPSKGIMDFLQVAEALQGEMFDFILIGPISPGFEEVTQRVIQYHSNKIIDYKGELDYNLIHEEFRQAHILFFPSYGEGMARVMLEAGFACVCPIAYDIPANRDLIVNANGFLVRKGDIREVISILKTLINNRNLLEMKAVAYQQYVVQHFNLDIFARRMDRILEDVAREIIGEK
jgi:glycosyltransferase involved in cell wall biosynthesis